MNVCLLYNTSALMKYFCVMHNYKFLYWLRLLLLLLLLLKHLCFYIISLKSLFLCLCTGNFQRDVGSNLPMLNLASENWANMSMGGAHGMLAPGHASNSQYGMWMSGVSNLSPNQNCAMPSYLRSPAPYSLAPTSGSSPSLANISGVRFLLMTFN